MAEAVLYVAFVVGQHNSFADVMISLCVENEITFENVNKAFCRRVRVAKREIRERDKLTPQCHSEQIPKWSPNVSESSSIPTSFAASRNART